MTSSVQLNSWSWVNCTHLQGFSESAIFRSAEKPRCHYVTYTWLFLFTLSIPFDQPSWIVGWLFYNSKGSKPNRLASPFGKRNRRTLATFELLSELPIPPSQWPDLVVDGALVRTLRPTVKMSSLELLQELLLMTVALPLTLPLCHVYQLALRLRFLLPPSLWPSIPMQTYREPLNWL